MRKMAAEAVFRMALVGRHERMSAERAYQLGMVSQLVAPDELRATAQSLAETVASNSPAVLASDKRALWNAFEFEGVS
jgi:enoyl-CoA hydratase/carnithine racemase